MEPTPGQAFSDAQRAFANATPLLERTVLRQGFREAAKRLRDIAKRTAQFKDTGRKFGRTVGYRRFNLRQSIRVWPGNRKYPNTYMVKAGARSAMQARLVEYGHKARDGSRVPPIPFMADAAKIARSQMQQALDNTIKRRHRQFLRDWERYQRTGKGTRTFRRQIGAIP